MKKVYFSKEKAKIVFSVMIGNKEKSISFCNFGGSYASNHKDEQKAIEETFYFKKGYIHLLNTNDSIDSANTEDDSSIGLTDYPEITNINEAIELLMKEPFNISKKKLSSPEVIHQIASENCIMFSNWPL